MALSRYIIWILAGGFCLLYPPAGFANDGPDDGLGDGSGDNSHFTVLDAADISHLSDGGIITHVWRDKTRADGAISSFAAVNITASPEQAWAVMRSCKATLKVVSNMKSCDILERAEDGSWDVREQRFRAPFPLGDVRTIFRSQFTPFHTIIINGIKGGDMKVQEGKWQIIPIDGGQVRVTYHAAIRPKIPVPRFLLRRAVRSDTPDIMRALRFVTESMKNESDKRVLTKDKP